jgi:hypothetical protein
LLRILIRWALLGALMLAGAFVVVYMGDLLVYKVRGSPQSKVTVNQYLSIPLKGNKMEYDYEGTFDEPCASAVFAQGGLSPCWQLRRHPNQGISN